MIGMSYKKLKVWQEAMELVKEVYELTKSFPREEMYGLISQMRRAVISVASNIAEGSQRVSDKDFGNFLLMSRGSLAELETQRLAALMLNYGNTDLHKCVEIRGERLSKMLHAFHSKLKVHSP